MRNQHHTVYLLLGGNLQNIKQTFISTREEISANIGQVISQSKLYKSPAWGFESENDFLNQVIGVSTLNSPIEVLRSVLQIENKLGRTRLKNQKGYKSRVIDIDILYFNNDVLKNTNLTIPHPEIENRRFTLLPLCDLIPDYKHPVLLKSNRELLSQCTDKSKVTEL